MVDSLGKPCCAIGPGRHRARCRPTSPRLISIWPWPGAFKRFALTCIDVSSRWLSRSLERVSPPQRPSSYKCELFIVLLHSYVYVLYKLIYVVTCIHSTYICAKGRLVVRTLAPATGPDPHPFCHMHITSTWWAARSQRQLRTCSGASPPDRSAFQDRENDPLSASSSYLRHSVQLISAVLWTAVPWNACRIHTAAAEY